MSDIPFSDQEGKEWTRDRVLNLDLCQVWDIGAGSGTYSDLLRKDMPGVHWTGVEIFPQYVETYGLAGKYDTLYIDDVRTLDFPYELPSGLIIFGDVLEHMVETEARILLNNAKDCFGHILVSLPIVPSPQGEVFGNVHETHHKDWSFSEMHQALDFCDAFEGHTLGVYLWANSDTWLGWDDYWDVDEPCDCGCEEDSFGGDY